MGIQQASEKLINLLEDFTNYLNDCFKTTFETVKQSFEVFQS
jgi:hypothetical protein